MPRVTHVKAARQDNPVCKQGEPYYWWKFRFGGKRYSLTRPKASQLTQSAYYGALYGLTENLEGELPPENESDFDTMRDDLASQLQEIGEECQTSLDNMPESLQEAPTGELLQERIYACESAVNDLESLEAPQEWEEIIEQQKEWDAWEEKEPRLNDFTDTKHGSAEDNYFDEHNAWEADEPDVDELEPFDMSEFIEAIDQCHV